MLALRPGQLVPASQLIDGLWPDHQPAGALDPAGQTTVYLKDLSCKATVTGAS
jgi:hypothetical protein